MYRCWRFFPGPRYVVQSADRIRFPVSASDVSKHEVGFWELFCEESPEDRSESYATLEEAIEAFDAEFGNSRD